MKAMKVPMCLPDITKKEVDVVSKVLLGGIFTTNDNDLAEKVRALISHGIVQSHHKSKPWNREALYVGHNYRMPNPLAAVGYIQLQKIR
jgi:dTDP-4-amino-4,6-dideoxygalactose transaminase